jgi:hypothetical protein
MSSHSLQVREWLRKNHTCPTCRAKLPSRAEREAAERSEEEPPASWLDYALPRAGQPMGSAARMYT